MKKVNDLTQNISIEESKNGEDQEGHDYDSETEYFEKEDDDLNIEWQNNIRDVENAYIYSAKAFLEWAKSQKKIKIAKEKMTWDPTVKIKDISLQRSHLVDKAQQYLPVYRINIKGGNSVCIVKNDKEDEIFFCRRGMTKFYDLIPEYFNENEELSRNQQKTKFLTLNDAKEKLENGSYKVHLYSLFKENGEHCQISYLKQFDMWLIATKNATLLVKNKEDIEKNYDKRLIYQWAKLISNEWFNILDHMKKEDIESLKDIMQSHTLIGDYCRNQMCWPILQQKNVQIVFYSVVENNSPNICLPVEEAYKIFNQFNLKTVRMTNIKNIENFEELKDKLSQELKKVATGRVEDEGQGEVVYIIAEDKNNSEQKTLSCCKLKNIEYKIYNFSSIDFNKELRERSLKEYLMDSIDKKQKSGLRKERFYWIVEKMTEYNQTPKPLDYYLQLAQNSFEYIDRNLNSLSQDILKFSFMRFLENIQKQCRLVLIVLPGLVSDQTIDRLAQSQKIDTVETKWLEDQQIMDQHLNLLYIPPKFSEKIKDQNLHFAIIGFDQLGQEQSQKLLENEIEELKQSKYSTDMSLYIKCKNKQQMIKQNSQKVEQFEKQLKQLCPQKCSIYPSTLSSDDLIRELELNFSTMFSYNNEEKPEQKIIQQTNGKHAKGEKKCSGGDKVKVTVIHPIAPPGSGKSYFCKLLDTIVKEEHTNCSYYSVSTDQIRQIQMQKLKIENPELTNTQLFYSASKLVRIKYNIELQNILTQISEDSKQAVIFLDKLFTFDLIQESVDTLKAISPPNIDLKISAFIIKSSSELRYKKNTYYLSETFNREHETLNEDEVQTSKIVFRYFQMDRNLKVLKLLLSQKYINLVAEIPLIKEQISQIDQSLVNQIGKCLDLIPPGGNAPNSQIYLDFIQNFNAANLKFEYPDKEKLKIAARNFINACININ